MEVYRYQIPVRDWITDSSKIVVVIPCYKVKCHILDLLSKIGKEIGRIYVVDDACPEGTGRFVEQGNSDPRVKVIFHIENQGVGGAMITGYKAAIADGAEIIVKLDGDGQMDPRLINEFISPILSGEADYAKGNRFYDMEKIREMPAVRLFGNAILSLMTKLSSGYWNLFDPTNGYTAINAKAVRNLSLEKISKRYFFESDMLFRLNIMRAVVVDVPMEAKYEDEVSNLQVSKIIGEFLFKHVRNFIKRIFYNYYLRDVSLASIELPLGMLLLIGGGGFGAWHWMLSFRDGVVSTAGTVMLAAMPILMGLQLVLAFIAYDIASVPRRVRYSTRSENVSGRVG
jgi:glycosyltransferase involved in cell wall biosynthesis